MKADILEDSAIRRLYGANIEYDSKYFDREVSDNKTRGGGGRRREKQMRQMCRSVGSMSQRKMSLTTSKNTEGESFKYGTQER